MPDKATWIYHFTHKRNLDSIIERDGLFCDSRMSNRAHEVVGNRDIKFRRMNKDVPIPPSGRIGDYVPFYFAPRSPMLYSIYKNNVPGCTHEQKDIVYLCSSAEDTACNYPCCFTNRNAALNTATFFNDIGQLHDAVDWPLMRALMWNSTPEDLDRRDRRMAEFLVYQFFPWSLVKGIGVYDAETLVYVQKILAKYNQQTPVKVTRDWYF